jgi:hypothetical protein
MTGCSCSAIDFACVVRSSIWRRSRSSNSACSSSADWVPSSAAGAGVAAATGDSSSLPDPATTNAATAMSATASPTTSPPSQNVGERHAGGRADGAGPPARTGAASCDVPSRRCLRTDRFAITPSQPWKTCSYLVAREGMPPSG